MKSKHPKTRRKEGYGLLLVLAAAVVIAACSRSSDFVFLNKTSAPAQLTYTFINPAAEGTPPQLSDSAKGPWRRLGPLDYTTRDHKTITVNVPPGSALKLFSISNYPGNDLRGLYVFPISKLTVANKETSTSVTVENERALLAFQRWDDDLYVFPAYEVRVGK